jgi:stage II sporulation protein D
VVTRHIDAAWDRLPMLPSQNCAGTSHPLPRGGSDTPMTLPGGRHDAMFRRARWPSAIVLWLVAVSVPPVEAADEFSGADKLRSLYSAEFRFTQDGLPVVPVALAQGVMEIRVEGEGIRLLPEGDGGPELRADDAWVVKAERTTPARLRYWPVVWRGRPQQGAEASAHAREWRARGMESQSFEQGTLFAVAGEVLDRREVVVGVSPAPTFEAAEKTLEKLRASAKTSGHPGGVYTELVDRPHGLLEATGQRTQARVRNEGVLWFAPAGDKPLRIEWRGASDKESGRGLYHGRVYVTIDRRGGLAIVNAVPENRLLAGLVPAEIFPSAHDEALKAQAIAARGELLAKIGTRHAGEPFRLCSQTHCQVYSGAGRETPRTTAAVEATRGEILFSGGGKELVDTVYSASCGGHTEHNENAWPDMPSLAPLRGHRDTTAPRDPFAQGVTAELVEKFIVEPPAAYCGSAIRGGGKDRFRWTVTRSSAELQTLLAAHRLGPLQQIEVLERGISGRARAVRLVGRTRSEVVRGELRIRQTFGGLRSSLFVVEVKEGAATFRGAGFGHGVGLCQTGAIGMAEAGKSYRDILAHYYLGSSIRKLW